MISRRTILRGLFAVPAVVAIGSLMPIRGVKYDPIVRLQTWKLGTEAKGEWWAHEGRLSRIGEVEGEMQRQFGVSYWEEVKAPPTPFSSDWNINRTPGDPLAGSSYEGQPITQASDCVSRFGVAHSVPRNDPPLMTPEQLSDVRRENADYRRRNQRLVTPEEIEHRTRWYAKFIEQHESSLAQFDVTTAKMEEKLAAICRWGV